MFKYYFFFTALFLSVNVSAQNNLNTPVKQALSIASKQQLHQKADWQHLMQYVVRTLGNRSSEIKSSDSFFSPDGNTNPKNELEATLKAMFQPVSDFGSADEHPRCKFIARYEFLREFIKLPDSIHNIECVKFQQWIDINELESVSLIFASGYFKNPASFYGHPLLKLNYGSNRSSSLLDITINNGAIVPPNENAIVYMVKGVFGGYKAGFSDTKFYQLNHDYSESDLRDLWEYQLNLTDEQKRRIVNYSWELLGQRFTYRFLQQNCGYFLEDLLQYALKQRISPRNKLYTLPATTFFNLVNTELNGQKLVNKIFRTPSSHNRLYEKFLDLSEQEKELVKHFVKTSQLLDSASEAEQLRAIDTLIDYYTFLISKSNKAEKNQPSITKRTLLYSKRLALKKGPISWPENITTTAPHTGSRPTLLQVGFVYNSELGEGVRIRLRPANYDLIDLDEGHVPNSTLNMFNIEAISIGDEQRITRFDLVNLKTLNISRTGLPGDGGLGWGFRLGAERAENTCLDCLVAQVSGSIIKGRKVNSALSVYSEVETTYHSNFEGRSLKLTGSVGLVGLILPAWKSQIVIGQRAYLDGNNQSDTLFKWRNRFGNSTRSNIVFDIDYDGTSEAQLSYGYYW